ncbi:MAG: RdgB/HAM1 family non-canonical purine NTP pyrophosphatase [Clostridium sp.]|nr:RdgB/HAM1 family non-canonical purine NTP pyrophosphatase [Clostridium sp.]
MKEPNKTERQPRKLVFATNNAHKLAELRELAGDYCQILSLAEIGCHEDIPETSPTIRGNAEMKALYVKQHYGIDCFADDTGLMVDCLGGEPGVRSARYASDSGRDHDSEANMNKLLRKMEHSDDRAAHFLTDIALTRPDGSVIHFEGRVDGEITRQPRGDSGFGYDPVFRPENSELTFAEMDSGAKNAVSHRGRAVRKLIEWLVATAMLLAIMFVPGRTEAAVPTGQWNHYASFTAPPQQVAAAGDKIYYTSGGALFCFDTAEEESCSYTGSGLLNDSDITLISYNPSGRYLVVAYSSGNIDLLYDDGTVVNISDIADSDIAGSKTVTGVDFDKDRIYISTDFGLVEYNDRRHEVVQSGNYGKKVYGVAVLKNHILIYVPFLVRRIEKGQNIRSLDNFEQLNGWGNVIDMVPLNDSTIVMRRNFGDRPDLHVSAMCYDPENGEFIRYKSVQNVSVSGRPTLGGDGHLYVTDGARGLYRFEPDGSTTLAATLPETLSGNIAGVGKGGVSDLWLLDSDGIGHYDLASGKVLSEKYRPEDMSISNIAWIIPSADGHRIYLTNQGATNYRRYSTDDGDGYNTVQQTALLGEAGEIDDLTLYDYDSDWELLANMQRNLGVRQPISTTRLIEDPDDPSTYYLASSLEGLFKITGGKLAGVYNSDNSPIEYTFGHRVFDVNIDPKGNLWTASWRGSGANSRAVAMLPADRRRLDPSDVKVSDWKRVNAPDMNCNKDARVFICRKSSMIFVYDTRFSGGMLAIDTRGTYDDFSDDVLHTWYSFTDQDGKTFDPGRLTAIAEDLDGRVWIGSTMGIIELSNPSRATDPTMTVNRLKVPRNDGTNQADYLLGSDCIYDISVDNANRKWIATELSGLYLASASGNEILAHYTPANSPLPTTTINCVYADRLGNSVFVGTAEGLFEFGGSASPAMEDYSEIYAYPNPVRPEYSGPVTIAGLMDGSLVKIADSAGNVVAQMRAEGGMAVWDACNAAGRRVATGVYYVMASTGGEGSSQSGGGVAKIMVVN